MKTVCSIAAVLLLLASPAIAQVTEEVEPYLVAPFVTNKVVSVVTTERRKIEGKVIKGDENKIVVNQGGSPVELPVSKILLVQFRRPKRSARNDFLGSVIGGVGLGFAGAAIGREAAQSIRSDGRAGRVGPIVGGIAFGFAGGQIGRWLMRRSVKEEVTLKILGADGVPKNGALRLPAAPVSDARIQPAAPRQ